MSAIRKEGQLRGTSALSSPISARVSLLEEADDLLTAAYLPHEFISAPRRR